MINIFLNGESVKLLDGQSLFELLIKINYRDEFFAVAVNRQFVPRIQHAITLLKENDIVEIITPMQGG